MLYGDLNGKEIQKSVDTCICMGFPGASMVKTQPANAADMGLIPGSGRSPREDGNPFQYSCLENPRDRGTWWAIVYRVAKSRT